ncbi:predicted protein [Naegleria gruberi]|uniref:Predicted protein n=1 Tax=Naegleria gruberi TaxID=5762 RepID=D2VTG0_NAEGR|nr:uncharacterized protein NAEGRDRAFT_72286 [Naegleria gruberi]EFC39926.1 predicted protein [Naegleria gruberi]|eukprot:XP_002672670.1 predicted protein [Naegleria gruberi strain NEG-M]
MLKQGNLSELPINVIFFEILSYCDYLWILSSVRLVCRDWNENYQSIRPHYFMINYDGSENDAKRKLMDSNKLHLVTKFSATIESFSLNFLVEEMERRKRLANLEQLIVSKLTNLQELIIYNDGSYNLLEKFMKIESLQSLELHNFQFGGEFLKCHHSKIKSLTISNGEAMNLKFNEVDWPLEKLSILSSMSESSWNSILESKFCKTLQQLDVELFELTLHGGCKFENLTDLKMGYFSNTDEELKFLTSIVNLKKFECRCLWDWNDELLEFFSNFRNLTVLKLNGCSNDRRDITGNGLSNFVNLINLTELDLSFCSIQKVEYLSSVTSLRILKLSNNLISDESLKDFHKLSNLTALYLDNNRITKLGVNYLSALSSLKILNL